ncbi:Nitrogen assimilation transcription factor nirA [Lasiodiplodia theobromae]|uniref:Nitrogen assimilation transcription factor nirA n=1 Tax=Lasiodiplodia theobromae TaxID=45133 RepID=A0A5N5DDZ2_9PEZI|nr:Nitrogen assimilation transcription factor nirA [Lasiodiplodia theobromae]
MRDHLLDLFWTWQNSWQRLVSRDQFLHDLHTCPSFPMGNFSSPALLSAIYALASRYSDAPELRTDPNDAATAGDAFAAEAKQMVMHEYETPTAATIQATALLSVREAAVDKEALGWMYCGMAVRMALSLGLHLDCSRCVEDGTMAADEAEDRDVTARKPSTSCSDETLPCPSAAKMTPRSLNVASCSIHTCELFRSSAGFLDSIYAPGSNIEDRKAISSEAHLRLATFYNNLPGSLKLSRSPQHVLAPNVYMLHLQYHTVMILLHRPFLTSSNGGLRDGSTHAIACQTSADCIAAIFRWYKSHYGLRKIPISAVHCAFTAAVILLAATTSDDPAVRGRSLQGAKGLTHALDEMDEAWQWSARAARAVRSIARAWQIRLPPPRQKVPSSSSSAAVVPGEILGGGGGGLAFGSFLDLGPDGSTASSSASDLISASENDPTSSVQADELYALVDTLPSIRPLELLGEWSSGSLHTGHPMDAWLRSINWVGITFRNVDDVEPIVVAVQTRDGSGTRRRWLEEWGNGEVIEAKYRGAVSSALVCDNHPIVTHFRNISEKTLLGIMVGKMYRDSGPFFFYLKR